MSGGGGTCTLDGGGVGYKYGAWANPVFFSAEEALRPQKLNTLVVRPQRCMSGRYLGEQNSLSIHASIICRDGAQSVNRPGMCSAGLGRATVRARGGAFSRRHVAKYDVRRNIYQFLSAINPATSPFCPRLDTHPLLLVQLFGLQPSIESEHLFPRGGCQPVGTRCVMLHSHAFCCLSVN